MSYNNIEVIEAIVSSIYDESVAVGERLAGYIVGSTTFSAVNALLKLNSLGRDGYRYTPKDPARRAEATREAEERVEIMTAIAAMFAPRVHVDRLPAIDDLLVTNTREQPKDDEREAKINAYGLDRIAREVEATDKQERAEDAQFEQQVRDATADEIRRLHASIVHADAKIGNKDLDETGLQYMLGGIAGNLHRQAFWNVRQGDQLSRKGMPDAADELYSQAAVAEHHRKLAEQMYIALLRQEGIGQFGDELKLFANRKSDAA